MDIGDIFGVVKAGAEALDASLKFAKGIKDAAKKAPPAAQGSAPEISSERLAEFYDQLLLVKQTQIHMLDAAQQLRTERALLDQERAAFKQFRSKVEEMVRKEVSPNSFAYEHQPVHGGQKEPGYFCVQCLGKQKFSLLQFKARQFNFDTLECRECGGTVRVPNEAEARSYTAKVRRGWDFFEGS